LVVVWGCEHGAAALQKRSSHLDNTAEAGQVAGKFRSIPLESLCLDTVANFKIYVSPKSGEDPVLYRAENLPFSESAKQRLVESSVRCVYIESTDEDVYRQYIEDNLDKIVADEGIESERKAQIMYSSASYLIRRLLDSPWMRDGLRRSEKLASNTVEFVLRDEAAFRSFLAVRSHDYYTYTHCVNVCVFCVALAQRLGVDEMSDLRSLGMGALLHDIGKSLIDKKILNKNGPLTKNEWVLIKRHPVDGVKILGEAGSVPEGSRAVVKQHHERCDGSGYPDGLRGEKIHPYGRLSAIVDVFDAMTTKRSYRDAVDSFTALLAMKKEMRDTVDQDMFQEFVRLMGQ
jgi:putative nucleotidyltransferase with HDIG domain